MRTLIFWALYLYFHDSIKDVPTAMVVITFMLVIFLDIMYWAALPLFSKKG